MSWDIHRRPLCSTIARGAFNRLADAHIGAAATDVAGHCRVDVGIVRVRHAFEQSRRRHDLARLAVTALDHFQAEPRFLHPRASWRAADAFDRRYGAIADCAYLKEAGTHRFTADMDRAGTALSNAATEFCAGQAQ
jgi:hypothetical protein